MHCCACPACCAAWHGWVLGQRQQCSLSAVLVARWTLRFGKRLSSLQISMHHVLVAIPPHMPAHSPSIHAALSLRSFGDGHSDLRGEHAQPLSGPAAMQGIGSGPTAGAAMAAANVSSAARRLTSQAHEANGHGMQDGGDGSPGRSTASGGSPQVVPMSASAAMSHEPAPYVSTFGSLPSQLAGSSDKVGKLAEVPAGLHPWMAAVSPAGRRSASRAESGRAFAPGRLSISASLGAVLYKAQPWRRRCPAAAPSPAVEPHPADPGALPEQAGVAGLLRHPVTARLLVYSLAERHCWVVIMSSSWAVVATMT